MGMGVEVQLVSGAQFKDAWALLAEYFEAARVVVRDERDVLSKNAMWLAYVDGEPAGCILLRLLKAGTGEIKRLYVRPRYRRMGLAGRMLGALEGHASAIGLRELCLDSMAEMSEALAFYERSGYLPCERYNDNPQADVFLRKTLAPEIYVREFEPGDEEAFWTLNEAWI
jgi:GNAT superfamily N-acetyltransferase